MKSVESAGRKVLQIILWILTGGWIVFCFFLSWQTGEQTTGFSQGISGFLLRILSRLGLKLDARWFHMKLRQCAHFGVFFITGLLTASSLSVSLSGKHARKAFWIAAVFSSLIAILAEVGKVNIPGRHLTWSETWLNVFGTICGVLLVRLIPQRK